MKRNKRGPKTGGRGNGRGGGRKGRDGNGGRGSGGKDKVKLSAHSIKALAQAIGTAQSKAEEDDTASTSSLVSKDKASKKSKVKELTNRKNKALKRKNK